MSVTRRQFVATTSAAAATVCLPGTRLLAAPSSGPAIYVPSALRQTEPDLAALVARAIDAARAAGATYADARLTLTREQRPGQHDSTSRAVGVRALVNGVWGYYGSGVWTPDEMARLATGAVAQAKAVSAVRPQTTDLGVIPRVTNGTWMMPVKYDPFDIPMGEKLDFWNTAMDYAGNYDVMGGVVASGMHFRRQHKVFASTEGSTWAQTTYASEANLTLRYEGQYRLRVGSAYASATYFPLAGRGWEYIYEAGLIDRIPQLLEEAKRNRHTTRVELGRYDIVFSGQAMATLLDQTLGPATELDRAMGYEANAGGTSYLNDPLGMLGTEKVASPLVTVTANRSAPGAAATVKWDDEGVVPEEFTLVKDGVLTDFQTTRQQAAWLASYYQKQGRPVRSHGCAGAESALYTTMQHAPNFALAPGREAKTFNDLVAGVKKGLAVMSLGVRMDHQQLNGLGGGLMYEIKDGKLGRVVYGGTLLFRAPELWKNVMAVGGPGSEEWMGFTRGKGEPAQTTSHSVSAVPALIKQVAVIDAYRKA